MDIEHSCFLSLVRERVGRAPISCESHEQDGETLPHATGARLPTASGDPAMALEPFDIGQSFARNCPAHYRRTMMAETLRSAPMVCFNITAVKPQQLCRQ
jgi:hypothetical protein